MKGVMVGLLIAGSAIPFIPSGVEGASVEASDLNRGAA